MKALANTVLHTLRTRSVLNSGILVSDRIVRLLATAALTILVARVYGPATFGYYNYAQSIIVLVTAIATLGLPEIAVREMIRYPRQQEAITQATFFLRLMGGIVAAIIASGVAAMSGGLGGKSFMLTIMLVLSLVFQSAESFEYRLQALQKIPLVVVIRLVSFAVTSSLKIVLLIRGGTIEAFALITSAEFLLSAVLLYFANRGLSSDKSNISRITIMRSLISKSYHLFFRAGLIAFYLKFDQIMVQWILGPKQLGLYAAAIKLVEPWFFVPVAVMASFAPILAKHWRFDRLRYNNTLLAIMSVLTGGAILFCVLLTMFSYDVVKVVLGQEYIDAAPVLMVYCWSIVFGTVGSVSNNWIVNSGMVRTALVQTALVSGFAICVSPLLIWNFGMLGAAVGFLATQVFANIIVVHLFQSTKPISRIQLRLLSFNIIK